MDERLLDVIIGLAAFLILVILLAVLPMAMSAGTGYLVIRMKVDPANIDKSEIGLLTELELLKRQAP